MEVLYLVIPLGLLPAVLAKRKSRSFWIWWCYGTLLFPAAIFHIFLTPDKDTIRQRRSAVHRRNCPSCDEQISMNATSCRYCGAIISNIDTDSVTRDIKRRKVRYDLGTVSTNTLPLPARTVPEFHQKRSAHQCENSPKNFFGSNLPDNPHGVPWSDDDFAKLADCPSGNADTSAGWIVGQVSRETGFRPEKPTLNMRQAGGRHTYGVRLIAYCVTIAVLSTAGAAVLTAMLLNLDAPSESATSTTEETTSSQAPNGDKAPAHVQSTTQAAPELPDIKDEPTSAANIPPHLDASSPATPTPGDLPEEIVQEQRNNSANDAGPVQEKSAIFRSFPRSAEKATISNASDGDFKSSDATKHTGVRTPVRDEYAGKNLVSKKSASPPAILAERTQRTPSQEKKTATDSEQTAKSHIPMVNNYRALFRLAKKRLRDLGYYTGKIDGTIGLEIRKAIIHYQADRGLPQDGTLDTELMGRIIAESSYKATKRRSQ